ncbi:hypothetical protein [Nocardioides pyridinolyticus]
MSENPLLERHRVLGVVLTLTVLVAVGWLSGQLLGEVVVRLLRLALGTVTGGGAGA